jgi:hypothetical protein
MGAGDEIMAAGQAEHLYRDLNMPVAICDRRGNVRWDSMWEGNPAIASPAYVASGQPYAQITNGVGCRPYIRYPFTAERGMGFTNWKARDCIGRIYLTKAELNRGEVIRDEVGPFLLLEPDVKPLSTTNKAWGLDRYRQLVERLPDVTFIRAHGDECQHFDGVRNIRTQTFREACGVLAASVGYVGNEGGFHHAAAALKKPAVVVFGGFISPKTTGYPTHVNLYDSGTMSPCGRWKPCDHCAEAMAQITVDEVEDTVRQLWNTHVGVGEVAACQ